MATSISSRQGSLSVGSRASAPGTPSAGEAQGGDWTTKLDYHDLSGRLEAIEVIDEAAQTSVVQLKYERDLNGLVSRRTELVEGRDEFFHMDGHHRLKEWLLDYGKGGPGSGDQASIYTCDAIDNLKNVSVSGSAIAKYEELFTHGSNGKPHALFNRAKKADPQTFFYDGRGRLLDGDGQQYTYTSFDLPRSITTPAGTTQFKYDASGSRVQKQGPGGVTTSIRGLYESREGPGGSATRSSFTLRTGLSPRSFTSPRSRIRARCIIGTTTRSGA
jgi:YD repeat-containing protein